MIYQNIPFNALLFCLSPSTKGICVWRNDFKLQAVSLQQNSLSFHFLFVQDLNYQPDTLEWLEPSLFPGQVLYTQLTAL